MELPTYFNDFLTGIRLTPNQVSDLITGHTTLRDRLNKDESLKPIIISTFLQGSYRRATAVRPKGESRSDVDVIIVTKLSKDEYTPEEALNLFVPFMEEHYKGKYRIQGRSIGIELSYVDLDLVVTSAPSESEVGILSTESVTTEFSLEDIEDLSLTESLFFKQFLNFTKNEPEWKTTPLEIPDRDAKEWKKTHPLEQIKWTWNKNKSCNKHYVNVVKALKWWRKLNDEPKYPKSYPFEHFIGDCCPDDIHSVAEGITLTLEKMANEYPDKPYLPDRGVPEHDVFGRVSEEDYQQFYDLVSNAAKTARRALDADNVTDSANAWRELFGEKFPKPPETTQKSSNESNQGGFTARTQQSTIGGGRFA